MLHNVPACLEQVKQMSVAKPYVYNWPCGERFMFIMPSSQLSSSIKGAFIKNLNARKLTQVSIAKLFWHNGMETKIFHQLHTLWYVRINWNDRIHTCAYNQYIPIYH